MHILNKYCDKILVLTLKDSIIRQERINQIFKDVNFDFFYGVNGLEINDEEYIKYKEIRNLSYGQFGCTLSHIEIMKYIIDNKLNNVLILEDDIEMFDTVKNLDIYFDNLPNTYEIVYFGMNNCNIKYDKYLIPNINNYVFELNISNFKFIEGTNAIFIRNYEYLNGLLDFQLKHLHTADAGYMEYLKQTNKTYHVCLPQIFSQINENITTTQQINKIKYNL